MDLQKLSSRPTNEWQRMLNHTFAGEFEGRSILHQLYFLLWKEDQGEGDQYGEEVFSQNPNRIVDPAKPVLNGWGNSLLEQIIAHLEKKVEQVALKQKKEKVLAYQSLVQEGKKNPHQLHQHFQTFLPVEIRLALETQSTNQAKLNKLLSNM